MPAFERIREAFQKSYKGEKEFKEFQKERLIKWRREPTIVRVEKPTNPVRAREIGYKAKKGFIVVRVRVKRSSGKHKRPRGGRRPSRMGVLKKKRAKSLQLIAEERAAKKFPNLEVLNSYWVGEDGQHKWFEVIFINPTSRNILKDEQYKGVALDTRRVFRGKTSAGKKMRGLVR